MVLRFVTSGVTWASGAGKRPVGLGSRPLGKEGPVGKEEPVGEKRARGGKEKRVKLLMRPRGRAAAGFWRRRSQKKMQRAKPLAFFFGCAADVPQIKKVFFRPRLFEKEADWLENQKQSYVFSSDFEESRFLIFS